MSLIGGETVNHTLEGVDKGPVGGGGLKHDLTYFEKLFEEA